MILETAVVMLTPACGMSCGFCVTEPFRAMDFGQALSLLEGLRGQGVRRLVLGGGEPFSWKHGTVSLAARAKAMGFHVQVGTNGIDLPEGFERLESIDRYVLPLESMDAAVHDALRVFSRSHHAIILDRLERLRADGKSVTVSTVVTRQNIGGLGGLGRFLEGYRLRGGLLHAWHLYRFLPVGRGGRLHAERLDIDEADYHQACDAVKRAGLGFPVYKRTDMYRSSTVGFFPGVEKPPGLRENSPGTVCAGAPGGGERVERELLCREQGRSPPVCPLKRRFVMFGMGPTEMIVIGLVAMLFFGKRLPDVGRGLGRSISEFKKGMREAETDVQRPLAEAKEVAPEPRA